MLLKFSIHYKTYYGQRMYLCGSLEELGGGDIKKAVPMDFNDDFVWTKEITFDLSEDQVFTYRYFVRSASGDAFYEVGEHRKVRLTAASKSVQLMDEWQGNTDTSPFLTAPFTSVFYAQKNASASRTQVYAKDLAIRVTIPVVDSHDTVYVCGNTSKLGAWNPAKALKMTPVEGSRWEAHLQGTVKGDILEYKFLKKDKAGNITWENGNNRVWKTPAMKEGETAIREHASSGFWLGAPRFFGTAVPVFALRTKNSCGIGDFSDLKRFGDWIEAIGQNVIQLLPINDTTSTGTWTDSYPYGGITVMALHPIYINITEIGAIKDKKKLTEYNKRRKELDALNVIDYDAVLKLKSEYLRLQYADYAEASFAEEEFKEFFRNNEGWLLAYSAFCTLRDKYRTAVFSQWGADAVYTPELVAKLYKKGTKTHAEMSFHIFVQYHLHKQLRSAIDYLHAKHIAVKGDIPIGITPNSVDAWAEPEYFNMGVQAGAPPDDFSVNGQNWGFPTYNWDRIAADDYIWWKNRFRKMAEYFDAYRIDHVLGFFRIWEIPVAQVKGLMGHFSPALPMDYDEICSYGFHFDYGRHATPYIRYYQVKEMFGADADEVMAKYLDSPAYEVFTLKEEFNTQRKIEDHFGGADNNIKDGLQALVSEVLFLEDEQQRGKFHPRISAQNTYSYKALSAAEKEAYNALYNHFFYERHNDFWGQSAMRRLPEVIAATNMLTCAEDLGMIPACVPAVMDALHMLSLEIFRMPKDPKQAFGNPAHYPYMSVCTTGTHDTSTLRSWWEEDRELSGKFFRDMLGNWGEAPYFCDPWVCRSIIEQHTSGNSMLTILPLQDWLSIDEKVRAANPDSERINVPANPKHYWRYRMHLSVEQLLKEKELNATLRALIFKD